MGEPEKKSGGAGWIIALVAVFLVGGMCVVGSLLAVLGGGLLVFLREPMRAPPMQERIHEMPTQAMPSISDIPPEAPKMPKLPEIPDLNAPVESKPPGE